MKSTVLALVIAACAISKEKLVQDDSNDDSQETVNGRTVYAIEAALRDRGIAAFNVGEWDGNIRAWVLNANGEADMQLFDIDTLQPLQIRC